MRLNTLILGGLLLAALSGCRSSWSKSEQIMFRTPPGGYRDAEPGRNPAGTA